MADFPPVAEENAEEPEPSASGHAAFVCALELAGRDPECVAACEENSSVTIELAEDGSATVKCGDATFDVSAEDIAAHMGEEQPELAAMQAASPGAM